MIALNVETTDRDFEDKDVTRTGISLSRDYEMLTMEICFLGRNMHLSSTDQNSTNF